ncbi:hypothetical protein HA482_18015 [Bradyrhizobium sp. INPA_01384B]|uniref:Uncharacterized protein n=1 Tax=Bradyrhizobium campsiandrae TaxID=1729892 RepID=A0ABR7U8E3_9BRAD|nr:hypothetical protein [Bradyrhizobium campsiandrae]
MRAHANFSMMPFCQCFARRVNLFLMKNRSYFGHLHGEPMEEPAHIEASRNVILAPARPDAVRLVEEELPIAKSRFRVLINRDLDGLDVRAAPTFSR